MFRSATSSDTDASSRDVPNSSAVWVTHNRHFTAPAGNLKILIPFASMSYLVASSLVILN